MTQFPTYLEVEFFDSAERTSVQRFRLTEEYDDVTVNIEDVMQNADGAVDGLNLLTWDQIPRYRVVIEVPTASLGPNVAANNQVHAFLRYETGVTGVKGGIEIPAWDDAVYDQNSNNLLSPAFLAAANASLAPNILDIDTGESITFVWAQSRTRKSGVKLA